MKYLRPVFFIALLWVISVSVIDPHSGAQEQPYAIAQNANNSLCVPPQDVSSLVASIQYAEENFLYSIGGNSIGEHMWWFALVGLNEGSKLPLSRTTLEHTVRTLREEGSIAEEFDPFLEYGTVQSNSNAHDFFRLLSRFCERGHLPEGAHSINTSLDRAFSALNDPYARYSTPAEGPHYRPIAGDREDYVSSELLAECTALLTIFRFDAYGIAEAVRAELETITEMCRVPDLIIDLRGNRGGLLTEAVAVTDMLLSEGIILSAQPKQREILVQYTATAERMNIGEIVVLISKSTASAAEIVSAALSQNDRAVLIGERTYGKGIGQIHARLANGGVLSMTAFRILPPSGESFHEVGIAPSVGVPSPETERILGVLSEYDEKLLDRFDGDNGLRIAFQLLTTTNPLAPSRSRSDVPRY